MHELLRRAATHAADFRASLPDRPIPARGEPGFDGPLPTAPTPPDKVLDELIRAAEPALMATPGPRFFGLVVGGALPAATAADMLAVGWDQLAFNDMVGPAPTAVEETAGAWLKELLGIPATASCGFVTGAQGANTVGLAAARHHVLREAGWDVERDGLIGAPRVRVVASAERHVTVDRSLRLLGFGSRIVEEVRADANGAIDTEDLARVLESRGTAPTIVVLQTGNVNTGACDDLRTAIPIVHRHGGWAHVDGAFGLWAAAAPQRRHLTDGVELADSWGCDGHKWLNVPYDSAFAFVSRPQVHVAALSLTAAYLTGAGGRQVADRTVESSRRARGFAVWAALRELGRDGVAELVERCCRLARRFADGLADAGFEVANDVVLNQVLVSFGEGERTDEVIAAVQRDGACWMGGTTWHGRRFMRIAVSNYATTEADVDRSVAAVVRCASA